jgi:hypothetical protein
MYNEWTAERENEYQELLAQVSAMRDSRESVKAKVKSAVCVFVRDELCMNPGSTACTTVEDVLFKHREKIAKFYESLPQLAIE